MNVYRIQDACKIITTRQAALDWLEEYGVGLTGDGATEVSVRLIAARGCHGAPEAADVLSAYGRFCLPDMLKAATECCRNDIAMAVDAIRCEVGNTYAYEKL